MSDGTKSIILFIGVASFFGLMVVGPIASDLLDDLVTWGAEQSNHTNPGEFDKNRVYAGTPLVKAHACCVGECQSEWDYRRDLCDPGSQTANHCLLTCIEAPTKAPEAKHGH